MGILKCSGNSAWLYVLLSELEPSYYFYSGETFTPPFTYLLLVTLLGHNRLKNFSQ